MAPTHRWWIAATLLLGCGPTHADWDGWDFAFLSAETNDRYDDPRRALMLGSSLDGRTGEAEPGFAVSSWAIAWSPDGDAIAYVDGFDGESARDGDWYEGLWMATPAGRERLARVQSVYGRAKRSTTVVWAPWDRRLVVGMHTSVSVGLYSEGWEVFSVDLQGPLDSRAQSVRPAPDRVVPSPDGTRYLGDVTRPIGHDDEFNPIFGPRDLVVYPVDGTGGNQLTTPSDDCCGTWSLDGESITYVTDASGIPEIVEGPIGGTPRSIGPAPCTAPMGLDWLDDGARLLVTCVGEAVVVDATDGTVIARHEGSGAALSPEGDRLLLTRDDTIVVLDLADGEATSLGPGRSPTWRPLVDDP